MANQFNNRNSIANYGGADEFDDLYKQGASQTLQYQQPYQQQSPLATHGPQPFMNKRINNQYGPLGNSAEPQDRQLMKNNSSAQVYGGGQQGQTNELGRGMPAINQSQSASTLTSANQVPKGRGPANKSLMGVGASILGPSRSKMDMNERSQSEMIRVQNMESANRQKQSATRTNLLA